MILKLQVIQNVRTHSQQRIYQMSEFIFAGRNVFCNQVHNFFSERSQFVKYDNISY